MPGVIFRILDSLPSKVFNVTLSIAALCAALWPAQVASRVETILSAEDIRFWGMGVILLVALYWLMWFWLRPQELRVPVTHSLNATFNNSPVTNSNVNTGSGIFEVHNHVAPEKFNLEQTISNFPTINGQLSALKLGGLAIMTLGAPYSMTGVTMVLDVTPISLGRGTFDGAEMQNATLTLGNSKDLYFDTGENKRQIIAIAGSIFIVTLIGIYATPRHDFSRPLQFVFSVVEK